MPIGKRKKNVRPDLPEPAPEPEDIDRVSREHRGELWEQWKRDHPEEAEDR